MRRRFSDQQLFTLRNHFAIDVVIKEVLRLPSKIIQGAFRFRCPLCGDFNTAINPNTNLARCFDCEKNFNPIDIVMAVNHTNFVETVNLLMDYKANPSYGRNQNLTNVVRKADSPLSSQKIDKHPAPIGQILSTLIGKDQINIDKSDTTDSLPQNTPLANRLTKLEQDVHLLFQQINQIKTLIGNQK
jgi:hypothetical protein